MALIVSWASRTRGAAALVVTTMALVLTGCGPTITAPDVVGMRLDEAHQAFEKLEVDDFDDVDGVGDDRAIMWDANWVVIKQEPPAGTKGVDTGETIKLTVANEDDDDLLDLIPKDSPVAQDFAEDAAEEAAEAAAEKEEADAEAEAEEDPYSAYRGADGFVTRADYADAWPLTVDAGFLDCSESFGERSGAVVFRTLEGTEFALNGQAAHDYPEIRPIWANDPTYGKRSRVKMSTATLIDDALDLC